MTSTWVKFEAALKAFADSAETQRLYDNAVRLDTAEQANTLVSAGSYDTANGSTDDALPMGDIGTGHFLMLESDQSITFKLSGTGNDALNLTVRVTGQNAVVVWMTSFTSVHVSNASGSTARVNFCFIGAA